MTGMPAVPAAHAFLSQLRERGVDYLYLGSGSDTAPLVQAYEQAMRTGASYPRPVISAHETVAVGMAHGYAMVTGRGQAVMLHVSVGAANAVCGLVNAARAQVPMLFTAGRTPLHEQGPLGARDSEIHWAQEMYDQGGMVREFVKWDYELRDGAQLGAVLDRALALAHTHPRGPVYLTLPREVLAAQAPSPSPASYEAAAAPWPDPQAVRTLALAVSRAAFPVIACTASGADPATVGPLVALCERFGIGVAEARSRFTCFPDSHPLHLGHELKPVFAQADALLFLESDVPWVPARGTPDAGAFVAHAGADPLFGRYPLRNHRSDLSLVTTVAHLLPALHAELEALGAHRDAAARRERIESAVQAQRTRVRERIAADAQRGGAITRVFATACLARALPKDAIVVNEYPAARECLPFDEPGRYFVHAASAGLGWGLPAALGAQQAAPGRPVAAFLGDGSYLFANPAACHHAARLHGLPVVTVVFNNAGWGAVQNAARNLYPAPDAPPGDTNAALSSLAPMPDLERYAEASGGLGLRVERREDLPAALERAFATCRDEQRQVLVNVIGQG